MVLYLTIWGFFYCTENKLFTSLLSTMIHSLPQRPRSFPVSSLVPPRAITAKPPHCSPWVFPAVPPEHPFHVTSPAVPTAPTLHSPPLPPQGLPHPLSPVTTAQTHPCPENPRAGLQILRSCKKKKNQPGIFHGRTKEIGVMWSALSGLRNTHKSLIDATVLKWSGET